jgi:hypothetical protein
MDPSFLDVLFGSLTLNKDVYVALSQSSHVVRTSVTTLVVVGLSWMLGHCAVLFMNRVPPRGFVVRTVALAGSFLFGALVWVGSTWVVASVLPGDREVRVWTVLPLTAFAYAPLMLSVLIIIPYVGSGLESVLNTWTLLGLVLAVMTAFEIGFVLALGCALGGWALTRLAPRLAGGRLDPVFNNAWYRVTSGQMHAQGEAAAADSVARLRRS